MLLMIDPETTGARDPTGRRIHGIRKEPLMLVLVDLFSQFPSSGGRRRSVSVYVRNVLLCQEL